MGELIDDIRQLVEMGVSVSAETLGEVVKKHEPKHEPRLEPQVGDVWEFCGTHFLVVDGSSASREPSFLLRIGSCFGSSIHGNGRTWRSTTSISDLSEYGTYIGHIADYLRERLCAK